MFASIFAGQGLPHYCVADGVVRLPHTRNPPHILIENFPAIGEETLRHATLFLSTLFLMPGIALSPSAQAQQQGVPAMLGFSSANAKIESDLEKR
ncbi:MAG TPA: hypothetical protein VMU62_01680, partial [Acidobacteriaceae bacterium]|nr:hypothetical protein [Acidobacteriaceae bacterium]